MADPITIGAIMMGAGGVASAVGGIKSNLDAAKAERENAKFYAEQAGFAMEAGRRTEETFLRETANFMGNQVSAFAKAGVDASGSVLSVIADTEEKARQEVAAIRTERDLNVKTAMNRQRNSAKNADRYSGFWNNALPAAGTLLSSAGSIMTRTKGT